MISPEGRKAMSPERRRDAEDKIVDDLEQMKRILEEARRTVKPIVKRELAAEVISVELLNTRLKNARRT
ncbi:hypothetical protein [Candidatus Palauibacter sp.]|uniref:hypothetical protein n=1 Tax=Candidatus Palauibacter sp. TaxID=3101350 RepID=UPI003B5BE8A2